MEIQNNKNLGRDLVLGAVAAPAAAYALNRFANVGTFNKNTYLALAGVGATAATVSWMANAGKPSSFVGSPVMGGIAGAGAAYLAGRYLIGTPPGELAALAIAGGVAGVATGVVSNFMNIDIKF